MPQLQPAAGMTVRGVAFVLTEEVRALMMVRSRVRHSRLQNQLIDSDPAFVARLHGTPSEARTIFTRMIEKGGDFEQMTTEIRRLCASMIEALSPARLIELAPLKGLPPQTRACLANTLHSRFLESSEIADVQKDILGALEPFEALLKDLREAWLREPPDPEAVRRRFHSLQTSGRLLHQLLGRIPEGMVLP